MNPLLSFAIAFTIPVAAAYIAIWLEERKQSKS